MITDGSILIDPRFDAPTSGVVPPACPSMQKCCTKANYIKNPSKQLCQTNPGRTPEPVTEITTEDYETSKEETITASTPKVTTRTTSTSTVEPDCGDYCIWNLTPNVAVTTDDYIDITTKSNVPSTPKNQGNRKIATTPQTTTTQTSESTTDEPVKPYVDPKQFIPSKKCGFRNENGIGGLAVSMQNKTRYAQYAEFPWMVAVLQNRTIGSGVETMYKGGGSLIHPKVVLTAASNFAGVDPRKIILRAGEWNMASKNELVAHEDRSISKVKRHEDFKGWNYDKNLAILLLNKPFEITAFINTVCLPPKNLKFEGNCLSSGWGKNKFGISGVYQMFLKKVSLPIVPSSECEKKLRKTKLGSAYKLDDGYLCAGKYKSFIHNNFYWKFNSHRRRRRKRSMHWRWWRATCMSYRLSSKLLLSSRIGHCGVGMWTKRCSRTLCRHCEASRMD